MDSIRLLQAALRGQSTPRPAWVPFVGVHGGQLIGADATTYLQSADKLVAGLSQAVEWYRPDGLPVAFDLQMEAEVLGCELAWAEKTPPSVASHPLSLLEGPGLTLAQLPQFSVANGRFPLVASALDQLKARFGEQIMWYGLLTGPFTLTTHLLGNDTFLAMYDEPQKVQEILAFCTRIAQQVAQLYLDHGAGVIGVVDPMTSQISSEHFDEFVKPAVNGVFDYVRQRGGLSSLFVCGDATRNLPNMCQTTCDNVSIDENIDLAALRRLAQSNHKSFGGNLKLTTVLLMGQPLEAQHDALRCLDAGGDTGFVLAPGCDLPYDTPAANLQAVAQMVHDPYQRQVAAATQVQASTDDFADIVPPDYRQEAKVIVDVVTLDSAGCAPCQYMMRAVQHAAALMPRPALVREHKITGRDGLAYMTHLQVRKIPTICIDGQVAFESVIPDVNALVRAIESAAEAKRV